MKQNLIGGLIQLPGPPPPPPETEHLSLHDRNSMLLNAVADIFGFHRTRVTTWNTVKRNVTRESVRELYMAVRSIWQANPKHLAPQPSSSLTALYLGSIDPEELARRVFRFGLYTDEIYIIDPFQFPTPPGRHPIERPEFYIHDTLHLIAFLQKVEPWIRTGRLTLIPDPTTLDPLLWAKVLANGERRKKLLEKPTPEELEEFKEEAVRRLMAVSAEPVVSVAHFGAREGPMTIFRGGTSLESMQRISSQSGAFPFTYSSRKWRELMSTVDKMSDSAKVWSPLTNAFSGLEFEFLNNVDPAFAARLRDEERLTGFRHFLKDLWQKAGATPDLSNAEAAAKEFRERLGEEYRKAREEWVQIKKDTIQWGAVTATGSFAGGLAGIANALILTGGINIKLALATAGLTAVGAAIGPALGQKFGWKNRTQKLRATLPMSVFVDLSEHRAKAPEGMTLATAPPK